MEQTVNAVEVDVLPGGGVHQQVAQLLGVEAHLKGSLEVPGRANKKRRDWDDFKRMVRGA